jgi:AraC-like DNA-binding protein
MAGRPAAEISADVVEEMLNLDYKISDVAERFGVSSKYVRVGAACERR